MTRMRRMLRAHLWLAEHLSPGDWRRFARGNRAERRRGVRLLCPRSVRKQPTIGLHRLAGLERRER